MFLVTIKNKTLFRIAYYPLVLGWFIFMWVAVYGSWHREYGVWIALFGLGLCMFGASQFASLGSDLFKSIDELDEEKHELFKTRKRLEEKIKQLQNGKAITNN